MVRKRRLNEDGFTLIEAVAALIILSLVLLALGTLMLRVSIQTRRSAVYAYKSAALQASQAWVETIPWDSLDTALGLGCATDTTGVLVYDRCTSVKDTMGLKRVTLVLTPTNVVAKPDTMIQDRAKPRALSPFR